MCLDDVFDNQDRPDTISPEDDVSKPTGNQSKHL